MLRRRATARSIVEDKRTTGRKYHDKFQTSISTAGNNAVAPAGGCVVSVICITKIAVAVESEAANQRSDSNVEGDGMRLKSLVMHIPISALRKCPPSSARGWASGACGAP